MLADDKPNGMMFWMWTDEIQGVSMKSFFYLKKKYYSPLIRHVNHTCSVVLSSFQSFYLI